LLGCQVAGQEKPLPNESFLLEHRNLAAVRYLFLIPPPILGPARETITGPILAGFKAIRAGDGRTLEDNA
jgi:hypothetical protein